MRLGMILASDRLRTRAIVVVEPRLWSEVHAEFLRLKKLPPTDPELPVLILQEINPALTAILKQAPAEAVPAGAAAAGHEFEPAPGPRKRRGGDGQV